MKHSRPDLANGVGELSKVICCANKKGWVALLRKLYFLKDTKNKGLLLAPNLQSLNESLQVIGFSDSDWAGDTASRKSVTGWIDSLMDALYLGALGAKRRWR